MDGSDEQRHLAYLSSFSQNYQPLNIAPPAPPSLRSMFSDGYRSIQNPLNIYNMRGDSSMAPYGSSFSGSYNIRPADMGFNGMIPSHAMQLSAEAYLPAELRYNNFPPADPAKNSSYQAYIGAAMQMSRARGCLPGTSTLAGMSSDDLRNSGLLQRSISCSSNTDGSFSRSSVHLSTDSSIDYAGDEKLNHELPKLKAHGNKQDSFSESCDQSVTNQLQPPPPLHTPVVQSQPSPFHMSHQPPPPPPLHTPMIRPTASIVIQPVELSDSDDEGNSSNVDRKLSLEVEMKPLPPLQIGNKALAEKMAEHSKQLSQLPNSETMPPIKMKVLPVETDTHSPVSMTKYGDYDVMPGADPTVVYISDTDGALLSRQVDSNLNGEGIASSGFPDSSSDMWQQQADSYGSLSQPQLSDYFVSKVSPENGNLVYNRNWHQNSRYSGGYPYPTPSYSEMSSPAMHGARQQANQMPNTTRNFGQAFSSNTAKARSALYETNNSAAQFRHRQRRRNQFRTGLPYRFALPFPTPGVAFNSNLSGHQITSPTSVSDIYDNNESNMPNYHNQDMSSNDMMNASRNQSQGLETDMAANLESVLANMKQESPSENSANEMNAETAMEMDNRLPEKDFINEDQTMSIDANNREMICVQDEDGNNMVCTITSMTSNSNNSFHETSINHVHGKSIAKNSSFMSNNKIHYWNGFRPGRESGDFRCHLCNYSGRSQHCLNKHYRAHRQAGKICRYCLRAFERPSDLVRHEDRHRKRNHPMQSSGVVMEAPSFSARRTRRQLLSCSKCPFTCRDAFKLSKHVARTHAFKFECNKCSMKFSTGTLLDRHKSESHPVAVGRIDSYVNGVLTKTNLVSCEVNGENDFSINFVEISEQLLDVSSVAEVSSAKDAMNILNQWFNKDQSVQVAQNSQSEQLSNQSSDGMQSKDMWVNEYVSASKDDPFVLKKNENTHGNISKDILVPAYSVPADGVSALNNLINIVNCNINSNKSSYSSIPIYSNKTTYNPIKPSYTELRRLISSSPTSLPSFIVSPPTVLPSRIVSSPTIHPTSSKAVSSPVPTTMDVVVSDNVVQQTDSSVSTNNLDAGESETYLPTSSISQDNQDETSTDTQGYAIETKYELCPMDLNSLNNSDINKNKIFLESIEPEEIMVFVKQESAATEISCNLDNPFATVATDDKSSTLENLKTDKRKVFAEHNGNVFVCVRCKYSTGAKFKYLQHLKAHSGRFICKCCNKACLKSSDLFRHWTSHNVKGPDGSYACDSCEFTSPRKDEVESHMKVHYNLNRDLRTCQNAGVMSRCGMCLKNVLRSRLFEHKRMAHGKFFIKPRVGSAELKTELGENDDTVSKSCKLYKCPKCERSLTTPSYLLRHYFDLHQQDEGNTLDADKMKTPLCRFCSVELDDVEKLHEREVSHVMSTCVEQSAIARQVKKEDPAIPVETTLQNHIANRKVRSRRKRKKQSPGKDQKGLHCLHCNKLFKQQYYLNEHMHLHSGELPYECKQCTMRFALFQSLVMHQMHKHPIDAYQGGKKIASFKKKHIAPSRIDHQVLNA